MWTKILEIQFVNCIDQHLSSPSKCNLPVLPWSTLPRHSAHEMSAPEGYSQVGHADARNSFGLGASDDDDGELGLDAELGLSDHDDRGGSPGRGSRRASSGSGSGTGAILSDAQSMKPVIDVGVFRLLGIASFMFANGLLLTSYGMVTLAIESRRFVDAMGKGSATVLLTTFLGLAGISQLVCPVIGFYSDRARSKFGKRRPFILSGVLLGGFGLVVQKTARNSMSAQPEGSLVLYSIAFTLSMIALNFIYTGASGLIPDLVPERQIGLANGIVTLAQVRNTQ